MFGISGWRRSFTVVSASRCLSFTGVFAMMAGRYFQMALSAWLIGGQRQRRRLHCRSAVNRFCGVHSHSVRQGSCQSRSFCWSPRCGLCCGRWCCPPFNSADWGPASVRRLHCRVSSQSLLLGLSLAAWVDLIFRCLCRRFCKRSVCRCRCLCQSYRKVRAALSVLMGSRAASLASGVPWSP